jgi:Arc/MetJ-type ribon-helix-helix transcriptional regulator
MAEGKRTRRSRSEVLQSKLEKLKKDQVKYTQKLQVIDDQVKQIEDELNEQRVDEVMAEITAQGLTIDQALEKLRS